MKDLPLTHNGRAPADHDMDTGVKKKRLPARAR